MKPTSLVMFAISLLAITAQADAQPGELRAEQVQVIRSVSQALLLAKKKEQPTDPALAGLRQGMNEARSLIDAEFGTPGQVRAGLEIKQVIQPATREAEVDGEPSNTTTLATAEAAQKRRETAHAKIARISARRAQATTMAETQAATTRPQMVAEAGERLQALEHELADALAEPDETRFGRLAGIRQRLNPQRQRELQVEKTAPGLQPTILTLTEHVVPPATPSSAQTTQPPATPHRLNVIKPKARNQTR